MNDLSIVFSENAFMTGSFPTFRKSIDETCLGKVAADANAIAKEFKNTEAQVKHYEQTRKDLETEIIALNSLYCDVQTLRTKMECEIAFSGIALQADLDNIKALGAKYFGLLDMHHDAILSDKKHQLELTVRQCARARENLDSLRSFMVACAKNLQDEGNEGQQHHPCPVCLTKEVDMCIDPCGHTMCGACCAQMYENTCTLCRQPIAKKIKMYFSV